MARSWGTTSDRITQSSVTIPTTGSAAFWVYPNWASTDAANHIFYSADVDANNYWRGQKFTDNALYFGWRTTGTQYRVTVASGSYTLTQSAWNHFTITWDDSANEVKLFLAGSQIGSTTTSLVTHASGTLTLGNTDSSISSINMDGRLAEYGIWSAVLSAGEIVALAGRVSPLRVRPASLQNYWPLNGFSSPEPDYGVNSTRYNLTVSSGTAQAAHAPVMPPFGFDNGWAGAFTAAAAATGQPTVKRMGGVRFAHSLGQGVW